MDTILSPKNTIRIIIIICAFCIASFAFAGEEVGDLKKEARNYRAQGLELQNLGDLDGALALYQKATQLDPAYAVVNNDLGVIYEAKGLMGRAEECYLQAIKSDPDYASAYTNLAILYENKRDLYKAAYYWGKRVELGAFDDPWTKKARSRLQDINLVLSENSPKDEKESEVIDFVKDVNRKKALLKEDESTIANQRFKKAKQSLKDENYGTAIKEALDAQQLDPTNEEIENFIEKVQLRALSR